MEHSVETKFTHRSIDGDISSYLALIFLMMIAHIMSATVETIFFNFVFVTENFVNFLQVRIFVIAKINFLSQSLFGLYIRGLP